MGHGPPRQAQRYIFHHHCEGTLHTILSTRMKTMLLLLCKLLIVRVSLSLEACRNTATNLGGMGASPPYHGNTNARAQIAIILRKDPTSETLHVSEQLEEVRH